MTRNFFTQTLIPAHRQTLLHIHHTLKFSYGFLLALGVGGWCITELTRLIAPETTLTADPLQQLPVVFTLFLLELVTSFFLYLVLPGRILAFEKQKNTPSIWTLLHTYCSDLFNESLRVASYSLLWSLLFVLPGIFKYLRWGFVPFVVLEDSLYQQGQQDALSRSDFLMKGITFPWALIMIFFMSLEVFFNYLEHLSDQWDILWIVPALWRLTSSLLGFSLSVYSVLLAFALYKIRVQEKGSLT